MEERAAIMAKNAAYLQQLGLEELVQTNKPHAQASTTPHHHDYTLYIYTGINDIQGFPVK